LHETHLMHLNVKAKKTITKREENIQVFKATQ